MNDPFSFQYCQKLIVLNKDRSAVLLARRKGEADYDDVYSFIGGKLETTDGGFIDGMRREKDEEVGTSVMLSVCSNVSYNVYFTKKDGSAMVIPHIQAIYQGGDINLSDEYADCQWVKLTDLSAFEPKIDTIMPAVAWAQRIDEILIDSDYVEI